jgi:ORF6N domain
VAIDQITRSILILRGQRVILDSDLAAIYGVSTGRLNEAVKRNIERFPEDFMLRLSAAEYAALISQIATSKPGRGGRRKLTWAFTLRQASVRQPPSIQLRSLQTAVA